ncbi:hypothetical protein HMPREF1575_00680 [Gardnerella vaginalis JCP7672]|nr:hypothetical protein HMPREF1575_00680 [Gardnerella vaginalis JCP7672]
MTTIAYSQNDAKPSIFYVRMNTNYNMRTKTILYFTKEQKTVIIRITRTN